MIIRTPIKIRKPIHLEYCNCYGQNTVTVEGVPQGVYVQEFENAIKVLETYSETVPLYVLDKLSEKQVCQLLDYQVPINLRVFEGLDYLEMVIKHLSKVPYSGVTVEVSKDTDFAKLRSLLHTAKSNKVHIIILTKYEPYFTSLIELFDLLEKVKNYTSHIMLDIVQHVTDEYYYEIHEHCIKDAFKYFYKPEISTRSWILKEDILGYIMESTAKHLKIRKITVELMQLEPSTTGRMRCYLTESKLLFGIRPFFYQKQDTGKFIRVTELKGSSCPNCEKPIFDYQVDTNLIEEQE